MPSKLFWFKSIYIKNPEMIIKKKYKTFVPEVGATLDIFFTQKKEDLCCIYP